MWIARLLLGRTLASREGRARKLGILEGVPALGLDGLASSAYGPEAALTVLAPLSVAASAELPVITLPILALLALLYVSYRQTIAAYPVNGGAYTVAKENLGTSASLLAAAGLMVDYILNVAVAISAGVAAVTSAIPPLHPYTLPLCLALLALITLVNLRGTIEAGRLFGIPTYLFIISFLLLIAFGIIKSAGDVTPVVAPPRPPPATEAISLWLFLRSFAAGCTAMTGVEAVSNGVSAFREPVTRNAHRALTAIVITLGILLAGISYLTRIYGISAMDQSQPGYQSVLSQLAGAVAGRGVIYYVAMTAAISVLCLSANTSFSAFPCLCRLVAQDGFLPRGFAVVGRRLVFSVGILFLALTSGLLLTMFSGITDRLIPLFAVGAFLTFTLSQAGMVVHWRRIHRDNRPGTARLHLAVNGLGATATAIALIIIIAAKFVEGAWITILAIPASIALLKIINRYYRALDAQLQCVESLRLGSVEPPIVLVTTEGWSRLTARALDFAISLSPDVIAVHILALAANEQADNETKESLRRSWIENVVRPAQKAGRPPPRLEMVQAPYRHVHIPILKFVDALRSECPGRKIAVLVPEIVKQHWWQHLLHTHRALRLRSALLRYGGSRVVVMSVPWYLEEPTITEAAESEEMREVGKASSSGVL